MGFFSRKPSREEQAKFIAGSKRIMPAFMRLATAQTLKFKDGREVDLNREDHRADLLAALQRIVGDLRLGEISPYTAQGMNDRARAVAGLMNSTSYEQNGPFVEAAQFIVEGLNVHEMLCFSYYEMYPQFEPLREMIEGNAKVMIYALDPLFETATPDFIKLSFPRFTEHAAKMRGYR